MTPDPRTDSELRDFLDLVRRRKVSIAFIVLVILGVTLYYTSRQIPLYQSTAEVVVTPIGPSTYQSFYYYGLINLETESGIARSFPVAEIASEASDANDSPRELLAGLSVAARPDSELLLFSYTDSDPQVAQERAQAFAEAYLTYRRARAAEQAEDQAKDAKLQLIDVEKKLKGLQTRLRKTKDPVQQQSLLSQQASLSARQGILQQQIQTISGQNTLSGAGGEVVSPADEPRAPVSPRPVRNAVLAIVVGLAIGLGLAMLRHRLDRRLRGRRDFESLIEAPVLATIPQVAGWRRTSNAELVTVSAPQSAAAEAYRALRTNVQYLWKERDLRVMAVTSAKMGDGKTTTVANLAVSLAQAGRRVIAVSCDLRKPRLHAFFGGDNEMGVTSLLQGEADLLDVVQRTDVENLRVIASGPIPPNPAELLSSDGMDTLLESLRPMADIVLIDSPPVLAVADALILGPKTDGVIVVADAGSGARDEVSHVRQELEQVGGRIIGGVFNSFDPERTLYYSPQYRRRYGYGYASYYVEPGTEAQRAAEAERSPSGKTKADKAKAET